jgi:hypothetical protein
MNKKLILLATGVLVALAFAALPSVAAAGEWECENLAGNACGAFSGTNNTIFALPTQDGSTAKIECTSNTISGSYATKTTGTIQILFHACTSGGLECHSTGQPNGTITTEVLPFDNVMLEATGATGFPNGTPGVLLTPNAASGRFETYICGGIITVHIQGNGLMGDVVKACGSETAANGNINLDFESVASGTQKWTKVTTTGAVFDLSALTTPSTTRTASEDGESPIQFPVATKITCP